jgi:ubiquinone/menaquinone biosynthesis C-methylase UbiE
VIINPAKFTEVSEETDGKSKWASGDAYEPYVGRWSRLAAREFLPWLGVSENMRWLDVGCGTGALCETILDAAAPASVQGIDSSEAFIDYARGHVDDHRARFDVGDARRLPYENDFFDAAVSGLAINFVPEPDKALSEMSRVTRAGGTVALYVWDYAGEMQMMRYFWDAAAEMDASAKELDEGRRFPVCDRRPLAELFEKAGLKKIETRSIDVPTIFRNFDDYWTPFLGGQGPAPGYATALSEDRRAELRELLRSRLPIESDGRIALSARAWAVRGER